MSQLNEFSGKIQEVTDFLEQVPNQEDIDGLCEFVLQLVSMQAFVSTLKADVLIRRSELEYLELEKYSAKDCRDIGSTVLMRRIETSPSCRLLVKQEKQLNDLWNAYRNTGEMLRSVISLKKSEMESTKGVNQTKNFS